MTAAVLAATRRLGRSRRPWGDMLRLAIGFAVVSVGGLYLAARTIQWVAGNEAAAAALEATALTAAATAGGPGAAVTLGIALQIMPEGLVVATALASLGRARLTAFGVAFATGLLEPVGGLIGALVASESAIALPCALSAAAGAMLFVVLHEMVPQLRSAGVRPALGALAGIVAMIALAAAV